MAGRIHRSAVRPSPGEIVVLLFFTVFGFLELRAKWKKQTQVRDPKVAVIAFPQQPSWHGCQHLVMSDPSPSFPVTFVARQTG